MKNKILIVLSLLIWISNYSFSQTITLSTDKTKVDEGQTITITATLSAPSPSQITINFAPTGTASNSIDYQISNITTVAGGNGQGSAANQFYNPSGVAIDATGNIYVPDLAWFGDYKNHRIQKWTPGASSGSTVAGGNLTSSAANQLDNPSGVTIDAAGNIYVVDTYNNRIQKWAPGASVGTTVAGGNGSGSTANQLNNPSGVTIDAAGNIYVADTYNNRIQKWLLGASFGTTVAGGNGSGSTANQLNNPSGVAIDLAGNIYVADKNNNRIQKWSPGASLGTTVAGGNGRGSTANQLYNPSGLTIDATGNIYVADSENHRIQKWVLGASTGISVLGGNDRGPAANQLDNPSGVAIDANGSIYVADTFNTRIQKWASGYSIIIPAGQTSGTLVINAIVDATSENDETIILTPTATGGSLASNNPLSLIITAQQSVINLSPEKTSFKEGQSTTINATLSAPSTSQTIINFAPSGTAQINIDFQFSNNNNQIIIPAGQTSGTLAISALFDPIINESDETIILTPTAIGGILASNNPLTLFILNVPDSDNDGITDDIDKCQGTPSGIKVNTFGCSEAQQIQKDTCTNVKPTMILKNGLELSTPLIGVGYVWYLNEIKIPNAIASTFLATSSGRYSVQVLKTATCITGLSENIFVQITGTTEENNQFIVFPNPFTKDIKIEFPPEYGSAVKVSISDIKGSIVYSQEQVINGEILNLSNFSTGTYFLTIYSNHSSEKRVFKLLKE
jgi:sugar lactone lactonase YvrE